MITNHILVTNYFVVAYIIEYEYCLRIYSFKIIQNHSNDAKSTGLNVPDEQLTCVN